jgi:hypothetical protein
MRELNLVEIQAISGAEAPPLVAAGVGAVIGTVGYLGAQAGSGQPLTLRGAASAATTGAVGGVVVPLRAAQAAGTALLSFYSGLGGGYVMREGGGDSGR